jgi:nicotinamide-nucleotide amidase
MFPEPLLALARSVIETARRKNLRIATAESCTGGLIAACLTEIPGSSDVFECGYITYSNESKTKLLGVPAELIEKHGAVSQEVAMAMAACAKVRSRADRAVSCTGIAGPDGGTEAKPVGLVYIGFDMGGGAAMVVDCEFGDIGRGRIREGTVEQALTLLQRLM